MASLNGVGKPGLKKGLCTASSSNFTWHQWIRPPWDSARTKSEASSWWCLLEKEKKTLTLYQVFLYILDLGTACFRLILLYFALSPCQGGTGRLQEVLNPIKVFVTQHKEYDFYEDHKHPLPGSNFSPLAPPKSNLLHASASRQWYSIAWKRACGFTSPDSTVTITILWDTTVYFVTTTLSSFGELAWQLKSTISPFR